MNLKTLLFCITRPVSRLLVHLACLGLLFSPLAWSRIVDDVTIIEQNGSYTLDIQFLGPMRYIGLKSHDVSRMIEIQLKPETIGITSEFDGLDQREELSWNKNISSPLKDLTYEGSLGEYPLLILQFKHSVTLQVSPAADLRSLRISFKSNQPGATTSVTKPTTHNLNDLLQDLTADDPDINKLIVRVRDALLDLNYPLAIQLLTKLRQESDGEIRRRAHEFLGVTREYNNQLAHAKHEYETFLEAYPEGEDSERIKQRLAALITAARTPTLRSQATSATADKNDWEMQFYGGFAQRYYRDETTPEDDETLLLRDQLVTDLDFVSRARKGAVDIKAQFVGSYRNDFDETNEDEFIPNTASIEVSHKDLGLYARVGRQSRTTGGVLGRFDGVDTSYNVTDNVRLNAVWGHPVDISNKNTLDTDKTFYGTSVDINDLFAGWDFTAFYIQQENLDLTDREAVGTELRYADSQQSYFTLVDYDILFDELNTVLFIGNWTLTEDTRVNLTLDYRNSPILTTTNSLQSQPVTTLDQLLEFFNEDEIQQLALDRTARSKTVTAGITHQYSSRWQLINELTATEFDETPASGGVEAIPSTDIEYYYSGQLVGTGLAADSDILILGLRLGDTATAENYIATANWRINATPKLRVNPRIQVNYRTNKDDDGDRMITRPYIRFDYRLKKWVKMELDLGYEWYDQTLSTGDSFKSTSYYLSAGYYMQF